MSEQCHICRVCGEEKSVEEMRSDRSKKKGFESICKLCRQALRRTNGEYTRERIRSYTNRKGDKGSVLISTEQLERLLERENCAYCGCTLTSNKCSPTEATIDHIYTLNQSYGSANLVEALTVVCRSCNSSKMDRHVYDFYCRSEKFTDELWTKFVREYTERLLKRRLTDAEVEQMKQNFAAEYTDLKRNGVVK